MPQVSANIFRAEKLQLLNLRPVSQVELQLVSYQLYHIVLKFELLFLYAQVIEEIDERFSDEKIEEILRIVSSELPPTSPSDDQNAVDPNHS